jgi:hypothetical protein
MTLSNIEARLNKRRNAGESIVVYVNNVLRGERFKSDPTTLQDFRPHLTAEELQKCEAMIAEHERKEAEEKAKWEAIRQAALKAEQEERNRIVALTPEQRVADLKERINKRLTSVVGDVEDSIDHNAEQFINDRLPWSIDGNRYDWKWELRSDIAKIVTKYIVDPSSEVEDVEGDEIEEVVDDFVEEVISGMLSTVDVTYDSNFAEESEEYRKLEAELMTEVMKLYESHTASLVNSENQ